MNSVNGRDQESDASRQLPAGQPVYFYPPPPESNDDEINLLDYWRVLAGQKWLIVALTVIATSVATVAAFIAEPAYKTEVAFMPADEEKGGGLSSLMGQFGGLASLAGVNIGGGGGKAEEALATLKSRAFTVEFIRENELMPVLFAKAWDASNKKWLVEKKEDIPSDWDAYKVFNGIRTVNKDAKTGMITLAIEWRDAEQAAQWANALIKKLNQHQKNKTIGEAQKSINYLQQQLSQTMVVEIQQAIYRLIEAQTKNIMLANVREDFAFKIIDPAVVPEEMSKPKRKLMVILGFVVGLMLGVFVAFFVNFIRNQRQQARERAV